MGTMDYMSAAGDVAVGFPAAMLRVLLERRVNPSVRWIFSIGEKVRALVISLLCGVVAGMVARAWPAPLQWLGFPAPVLVMAVAFLGQDAAIRVLPRLMKWLNKNFPVEPEESKTKTKGNEDDESE